MDVFEAIVGRRSVRRFKDDEVSREKVMKIIEAARWAPSACNRQLWQFVVVDRKFLNERLGEACKRVLIINPPVTIFVLYDKNYNLENFAYIQSASAAAQNMLLAAYGEGLGSCWIEEFGDEAKIKRELNIPDNYHIINAIGLGYPNYSPIVPKRRELKDLVHFGPMENVLRFPKDGDPKLWNNKLIVEYVECSVHAKSAFSKFYQPVYKKEFETEIKTFPNIGGTVLYFFPFSGNYIHGLMAGGKVKNLIVYHPSQSVLHFVKSRVEDLGTKDGIVYINDLSNIAENTIDAIIVAKKFEILANPEEFIVQFERLLKKNGRVYVLYSNAISMFYMVWNIYHRFKPRGVDITGPIMPISPWKMKEMLNNFYIRKSIGISIVPKRLMEGFNTRMPGIKLFCKNLLYECELKN